MRIQPKTEKKETVRIDIGQSQFPTVLSPSAADDTSKKTTTRIDAAAGMKPLSEEDRMEAMKKSTIRIETPLEMNPMAEDDRYAAAKKATVRIETAAEMSPMSEQDKQEAAKKSTVRVQVDEEKAKGDTAKLNMRTAVVDQEAKKKTSRIDLKEVLDGEEEDIFKRRTALLDASKFQAVASESASAAGVPRTIRIKRPDTQMVPSGKPPTQAVTQAAAAAASLAVDEVAKKSETARIDLPPEVMEQPPTRRKTIRIKRPEGTSTSKSLVIARPTGEIEEAALPAAAPGEEEASPVFSLLALAAVLVAIALVTMQSLTIHSFSHF